MKRSTISILLLMSFLLALTHEVIPHHHHDELENNLSFHHEQHSHSNHDHKGHDHEDDNSSNHHPFFPGHEHLSVAGDFNFIRFSDNDRSYLKDKTHTPAFQTSLIFTLSAYHSNDEHRWRISETIILKSSWLSTALRLRGPPSLS